MQISCQFNVVSKIVQNDQGEMASMMLQDETLGIFKIDHNSVISKPI